MRLFTRQQRVLSAFFEQKQFVFNIHNSRANDYYPVILILSCLSCDYDVEFIEQGGRMFKIRSYIERVSNKFNFLAENVYAKHFMLSTRTFMPRWAPWNLLSNYEVVNLSNSRFAGNKFNITFTSTFLFLLCFLFKENRKQSINFHL